MKFVFSLILAIILSPLPSHGRPDSQSPQDVRSVALSGPGRQRGAGGEGAAVPAAAPPAKRPRPAASALLAKAADEARKAVPKAAFYSALVRVSADAKAKTLESWLFEFGDPGTGAVVRVPFEDSRMGAARREALPAHPAWKACLPAGDALADGAALERRAREYSLAPDASGRFVFRLFAPKSAACPGLASGKNPYAAVLPLPDALYGRALWVTEGAERALALDGRTGDTVLDRKKSPKR